MLYIDIVIVQYSRATNYSRIKMNVLSPQKHHSKISDRYIFYLNWIKWLHLSCCMVIMFCSLFIRSSLGCTSSCCKPAESPTPFLWPPSTSVLQPQCDRTVTHHRSNPVHPDTSGPAAPPHDHPLPAHTAVDSAGALLGAEHAQSASVPSSSANGYTDRPHCPSQPGGSSKPSQLDGQWPLNLSLQSPPAPAPSSHQWTGSSACSAYACRQSGRSQWVANAADGWEREVRVQWPGTPQR